MSRDGSSTQAEGSGFWTQDGLVISTGESVAGKVWLGETTAGRGGVD